MRYKPFGNTGMEVSELALGTWGIGGAGWDQRSEEDRLSAIRTAWGGGHPMRHGVHRRRLCPGLLGGGRHPRV